MGGVVRMGERRVWVGSWSGSGAVWAIVIDLGKFQGGCWA